MCKKSAIISQDSQGIPGNLLATAVASYGRGVHSTPLWGCGTCCAKVLLGLLQGVLEAEVVQVVYSATTRTRPPTPHPPETAANVKGGWLLLPAFQLLIIIIIIITRPKPAYGRQGLANISLRASGAQLRSDEVIDKHTLYHNIYIIIRPQPA